MVGVHDRAGTDRIEERYPADDAPSGEEIPEAQRVNNTERHPPEDSWHCALPQEAYPKLEDTGLGLQEEEQPELMMTTTHTPFSVARTTPLATHESRL